MDIFLEEPNQGGNQSQHGIAEVLLGTGAGYRRNAYWKTMGWKRHKITVNWSTTSKPWCPLFFKNKSLLCEKILPALLQFIWKSPTSCWTNTKRGKISKSSTSCWKIWRNCKPASFQSIFNTLGASHPSYWQVFQQPRQSPFLRPTDYRTWLEPFNTPEYAFDRPLRKTWESIDQFSENPPLRNKRFSARTDKRSL